MLPLTSTSSVPFLLSFVSSVLPRIVISLSGITTRGECTFGEKAKFAEKSGSGAKSLVVISNDTDLFAPFINATELAAAPIAVVLIDQPHGQLLLNKCE